MTPSNSLVMTPEELQTARRLFTTASRSEDRRRFAQLGAQIMDTGRALLAEVEALRKERDAVIAYLCMLLELDDTSTRVNARAYLLRHGIDARAFLAATEPKP